MHSIQTITISLYFYPNFKTLITAGTFYIESIPNFFAYKGNKTIILVYKNNIKMSIFIENKKNMKLN